MRLSQARAKRLLTVRDLARQSGVSESNIHHVEYGDWLPSLATVRKLVSVLEIEAEEVSEFKAAIQKAGKSKKLR